MKYVATFLATLGVSLGAIAQDTHYWTQSFGTRAALLGGAVVAGSRDNTTLYYNAAALAFIDTASVSINANLYQIENIRIENAIGQRTDFRSSHIATIPLLVTGMFGNRNRRLKIGYGFVSPVNFDFQATARIDSRLPIVDDAESPGPEEFIGQQSINTSLSEVALAIGMGYKINNRFGLGITHLFTLRSAEFTKATLSRFFLNNANHQLVTATILQNVKYYHIRYAARLAAVYQWKNVDAGITFTTPGLRIMGNGTVGADITATDIKFRGTRQDLVANDRQAKLKTRYRSPYAISAGLNLRLPRQMFTLTAMYAGSEEMYDVLSGAPAAFVRPADLYPALGSENFLRVKTAATSVFNVAIGYERPLGKTFTLLASLRSNQSYYDKALLNVIAIKPDLTSWDIYHLTVGGTIQQNRSSISVGLTFSLGTDNSRIQDGNFNNVQEDNFLQGATTITRARYSAFGLLLGYSYNFRKF